MPVNFNANNIQPTVTTGINQVKAKAEEKSDKSNIPTGAKVAVGAGLAALATAGIYMVSKGRANTKALKEAASAAGFEDVNLYKSLKKSIGNVKLEARENLTLKEILDKGKEYAAKNKDKLGDEPSLNLFNGDAIKDIIHNKDAKIPENAILMRFTTKVDGKMKVDKNSMKLIVPKSVDDGIKEVFKNGSTVSIK